RLVLRALEAVVLRQPLQRDALVRTRQVERVDMTLRPHDDHLLLAIDGDAVGGRKRKLLLAGRLDAVNEQHGESGKPERRDDLKKTATGWTVRTTHPMLGSATPPRVVRNQRARLAIALSRSVRHARRSPESARRSAPQSTRPLITRRATSPIL